MMRDKTSLYLFLFLLIAYAGLWLVAMEPPLEDAFISMHAARNLWQGDGLVFNPGERVEAVSNMAWTLLLALLGGVFGNYLIASKILGFIFSGLTFALLFLLLRKQTHNLWIVASAAGLLLLSPYFLSFSVYGLESPMQTALLLGLLYAVIERRWALAGVALGLLPWCRPEGLFFLPPVWLLGWYWERKEKKFKRMIAVSAAVAGLLLLFRLVYYHDILPNTVYSKSIALVSNRFAYLNKLSAGLGHVTHFFLDAHLYLWLPALVLAVVLGVTCKNSDKEHKIVGWRWLFALSLIQLGFVIISGGNVFLRYRFLSALYPLLCLAAGWGLAAFEKRDPKRVHTTLIAALALLGTLGQIEYERSGHLYWKSRADALQSYSLPQLIQDRFQKMGTPPPTLNTKLGFIVRDTFQPETLIAAGQIGQLGFYGERPILDMVGLADHTIAHEGGSLAYFLSREPALFILLGSPHISDAPNVGLYSGLWGTDEFRKQYQWTRVYRTEPPTETFYWIERRKEPLAEAPRKPDQPQRIMLPLFE